MCLKWLAIAFLGAVVCAPVSAGEGRESPPKPASPQRKPRGQLLPPHWSAPGYRQQPERGFLEEPAD